MPIGQRSDVLGKVWLDCNYGIAQSLQSCCTDLLVCPLGKDAAHLPIIEAVEDCHHAPIGKSAPDTPCIVMRVFRQVWQPEPENIHRRGGLNHFEPREIPPLRKSSVRANGQRSPYLVPPIGAEVANAANRAVLFDQ